MKSTYAEWNRMARFHRNTRRVMERHRVRCPAMGPSVGFRPIACFGRIYHDGEHAF